MKSFTNVCDRVNPTRSNTMSLFVEVLEFSGCIIFKKGCNIQIIPSSLPKTSDISQCLSRVILVLSRGILEDVSDDIHSSSTPFSSG